MTRRVDIHIPADKVWDFFHKNVKRLTEEMVNIAENKETEYAVYLTEDNGYPSFVVCKGSNDPEYTEGAINKNDCTDTARRCYEKYLFPVTVVEKKSADASDGKDDIDQTMMDTVFVREDELREALCDFLQVALQEGEKGLDILDAYGEAIVDEVLDHILDYLTIDHGYKIYRPTILVDGETGEEVFVEYPYECADNPFEEIEDDSTVIYNNEDKPA